MMMKGLRDLWVFSYFLFHWFFFPLSRSFVISSSSSPSTSSFVRRRHHCQHCRPRCHCQTMVPPPSASPRYPFLPPFLVLEVFSPLGYICVCVCYFFECEHDVWIPLLPLLILDGILRQSWTDRWTDNKHRQRSSPFRSVLSQTFALTYETIS